MSEHGVPDSRITVIKQTEDYIQKNEVHIVQWLCECNCKEHNRIIARGCNLKNGHTKSCGCLPREKSSQRLIGNKYGSAHKKHNKIDLSGEFGIIWSSNTNEEIYFDLIDAETVIKHCWSIGTRGYPVAMIDGKPVTMHVLLGFKNNDNKDRNKLNNRRSNLRLATSQENSRNRSIQSNNSSGIIGVSFHKERSKWEAYINIEKRKRIRLGYYNNKEGAIIARLKAEKEYFGEFAPQGELFGKYGIT